MPEPTALALSGLLSTSEIRPAPSGGGAVTTDPPSRGCGGAAQYTNDVRPPPTDERGPHQHRRTIRKRARARSPRHDRPVLHRRGARHLLLLGSGAVWLLQPLRMASGRVPPWSIPDRVSRAGRPVHERLLPRRSAAHF